jgi:hypothetical protein
MTRTRSAILALSLLGVFPHAAWAQTAPPPTDLATVSATVGVTADVGAAAAGGGSHAPSLDAAATVRTANVDASASATVGVGRSGGPRIALDASVHTATSRRASRPAVEPASDEAAAPSTRASGHSPTAGKGNSTDAPARAERTRKAPESVMRSVPDVDERASLSLEAPVDTTRTPPRLADDADLNTGGPSPDEAAPSAGGVSGIATLVSLAVLLIPLATWAIEHAAAGSPRRLLPSFLERPG